MRVTLRADKLSVNPQAIDRRGMQLFCVGELFNVQNRLAREIRTGKNAHGQPIKPGGYSEAYKMLIRRAKAGFRVRGRKRKRQRFALENKLAQKNPNVVDLRVTGDLINSFQVRPDSTVAAKMFISGGDNIEKARVLHERGFTGWFEYGKTDIENIDRRLRVLVDDLLKKLVEVKKGAS